MNSLLYYYNNVQKMAAYRQGKRMLRGVKLGSGETGVYSSTTPAKLLLSNPISIGTSDFTIEYYGNAYGSGSVSSPLLFNRSSLGASAKSSYFQAYGLRLGENNLNWVTFGIPEGGNITTDSLNFNYSATTIDAKFHLVITRQGKNVSVCIDNVLVASKEQTEIKDIGEFVLGIANSSDVGFVRVWNYALSADEIATLYNNGDPMGYVVPKAKRGGLLAEYLPQNLMESRKGPEVEPMAETYEFNIGSPYSQTVVSGRQSWLDSAKQMPLSDEYVEPLFQSIGGYDMAANGAPEILVKEPETEIQSIASNA